ncbi:MAG TPA: hypothetical protein VG941_01405 [Candidatus Paceibacterota bacterium]|nr:hypothetical protein [Candidatus Paceibacterota bacterium]
MKPVLAVLCLFLAAAVPAAAQDNVSIAINQARILAARSQISPAEFAMYSAVYGGYRGYYLQDGTFMAMALLSGRRLGSPLRIRIGGGTALGAGAGAVIGAMASNGRVSGTLKGAAIGAVAGIIADSIAGHRRQNTERMVPTAMNISRPDVDMMVAQTAATRQLQLLAEEAAAQRAALASVGSVAAEAGSEVSYSMPQSSVCTPGSVRVRNDTEAMIAMDGSDLTIGSGRTACVPWAETEYRFRKQNTGSNAKIDGVLMMEYTDLCVERDKAGIVHLRNSCTQ